MLNLILGLHIAGGAVALLSMFVPMLTRKGGTIHRRSGWVFVAGMTVVSATALVLALARILSDPRPEARAFSAFLFYVAILTASGVSSGLRVLRFKQRTGPHRGVWDIGLASALLLGAAAMAIFGAVSGRVLFVAFAAVGAVGGASQLAYWLRPPSHHMHWWFEHMGGMLGACVAATTAFLVLNAGRLGLGQSSLIVWLTPTIAGVPAIAIWTAYYRRRFRAAAGARRGTSPPARTADPYTPAHSA